MQISEKEWKQPKPLRRDKAMLPDFPINCLPDIVKAMTLGVAETTSTDTAMTATSILSALSHCFSGVYRMYGKQDHSEPITLYSIILANPAERKSPVMRFVKAPFISFCDSYNTAHKEEIYASEEKYRSLRAEIEKMQNSKEYSSEEIAEKRAELDKISQLDFKRVCVDDVTPEALVKLLDANRTLLMLSDEAGVFKNFGGRYANGTPNIDLLLKCWGGEVFIKDRCNSETIKLERPYLSVCLCGQPYILDELMNNNAFLSSGLVARFLYCFPKSFVGKRSYDTRPIDKRIVEAYSGFVRKAMQFKSDYNGEEIALVFSEEAHKIFADYYNTAIEPVMVTDFAECPDWGGKYHGLILRFCGIIHCIKCISDDVPPESREVDIMTLGQAIDIAVFYKEQARYAYGLTGGDSSAAVAEYVIKRLRANSITEITGRDLLHLCRKFRTMDELMQPVEMLMEYGYIRKVLRIPPDSKKQTAVYEVNPLL